MNNPWETGSELNGHRFAYCDSQSRIDAIKGMTDDRLAAALAWADTQKTVKAKIISEIKRRSRK